MGPSCFGKDSVPLLAKTAFSEVFQSPRTWGTELMHP